MGNETSKANRRRRRDTLYDDIFVGRGIDIGAGSDNLNRECLFDNIESCESFDVEQGDAQRISAYRSPESYDFVYSSHCLEHMPDPPSALREWFGLLRSGGHMVVVVPDEDLYEQGVFPSRFNSDHKWTFTICKPRGSSWSPRSMNVCSLLAGALSNCRVRRIDLCDAGYDHTLRDVDQTAAPHDAEANIEFIVQKRIGIADYQ